MLEENAAPPSSAPAAPTLPAFICDCEEWMRSACAGEPFYKEHAGKRYCVLHFPGQEKSTAFDEALRRKIDAEDFNFGGVWFPDGAWFITFTFNAEANFLAATFNAKANFLTANFNAEANFGDGADLRAAAFTDTFSYQVAIY